MNMAAKPKTRPKYYDVNLTHLPPPGLVSIIHRMSGAILFFPVLPLLLYALHETLGSEQGYGRWHDFLDRPVVKIILLGVVWLYAHHFFAGIRFLFLDLHVAIAKQPSRVTAVLVLVLGLLATLLIGWRIW